MDTFNEQIIKIRTNAKTLAVRVGIWLAAILLSTVFFMFLKYIGSIILLLEVLLFWGALKLTRLTSVEYEYILTNGELDIDKITAQSSRKRIVTINCADIEKIGKYQSGMQLHGKLYICCNENDNAYYIITRDKQNNSVCLVIAPEEKMKNGIKSFLPRIIQKDAFAD